MKTNKEEYYSCEKKDGCDCMKSVQDYSNEQSTDGLKWEAINQQGEQLLITLMRKCQYSKQMGE